MTEKSSSGSSLLSSNKFFWLDYKSTVIPFFILAFYTVSLTDKRLFLGTIADIYFTPNDIILFDLDRGSVIFFLFSIPNYSAFWLDYSSSSVKPILP